MAVNPLIALQSRAPDISSTFSNALLNIQRIEQIRKQREQAPTQARLLEAQAQAAEAQIPTAQQQRIKSVVTAAIELNRFPTDAGKLEFAKNRRQRLIDEGQRTGQPVNTEDTDLYISKLESGDTVGAQQLIDNSIRVGQQLGIVTETTAEKEAAKAAAIEAAPGVRKVKSSKILDSGVTQVIFDDGTTEVIEPTPRELELIRRAEERGVDIQQRRAQGRVLGTDAAKIANKAFVQTSKIRSNNIILRKVIAEVRGGAETGPLASKLPSFRAASVRLDTLRNQLGLDVVGSVTFGALSEGELNLALSTALPTGLEGPELVKWAEDKISAQEKLSGYFEEQAVFLSQPGNTSADWLIKVKSEEGVTPPAVEEAATTETIAPAPAQPIIRFNRQGQRIE